MILVSVFSTRGQMALLSHISQLTKRLVQQIGRGGCSLRAASHTSLKHWLGVGFKNTGGNINTALGRSGLRRRFAMRLAWGNIYPGFETAALSDMASANAVETPGGLNTVTRQSI